MKCKECYTRVFTLYYRKTNANKIREWIPIPVFYCPTCEQVKFNTYEEVMK